jgi:hypothetical protein
MVKKRTVSGTVLSVVVAAGIAVPVAQATEQYELDVTQLDAITAGASALPAQSGIGGLSGIGGPFGIGGIGGPFGIGGIGGPFGIGGTSAIRFGIFGALFGGGEVSSSTSMSVSSE